MRDISRSARSPSMRTRRTIASVSARTVELLAVDLIMTDARSFLDNPLKAPV
jgi:hypothetical protein